MTKQCDVAIIGGGPVGVALALALQDNDLKVKLLEARTTEINTTDPRALALSYGTRLLLQRLKVWDTLPDVSSISTIEITQKNSTDRATLRAKEFSLNEMGYVLPYTALHAALQSQLNNSDTHCIYGAAVNHLASDANHARIHYQHQNIEHILEAKVAIVADGGRLLEQTYPPKITDYEQSAIITHVKCSNLQASVAFEHFTPQGPMALLPYLDGYELVLTVPQQSTQAILDWEDKKFLSYLQEHFGTRVGEFTQLGKRSHFPLRLKRAPHITLPHTILIGNAAQTLHPVAGQGFNMGIRDAWELAQIILDNTPEHIGNADMCKTYRHSRRIDRTAGIHFTDGLVKLFSNDIPLLDTTRAKALTVLNHLPLAKQFIARRMMFGANG